MSVKKSNRARLFLACANEKIKPGILIRLYKLRWAVEIFHKEVKSYLGFEDPGLMKFEAIHSHVLWVYVAYLLLSELVLSEKMGVLAKKQYIQQIVRKRELAKILQLNARFDAREAIKRYCFQAKTKMDAAW